MQMINEIGRRVMQGGSRRSAIYASLNWKHPDIDAFLKSKNWYDMPIGTTEHSIGQIKEQDFNFPAPLDMTNISVNYDTEWPLCIIVYRDICHVQWCREIKVLLFDLTNTVFCCTNRHVIPVL